MSGAVRIMQRRGRHVSDMTTYREVRRDGRWWPAAIVERFSNNSVRAETVGVDSFDGGRIMRGRTELKKAAAYPIARKVGGEWVAPIMHTGIYSRVDVSSAEMGHVDAKTWERFRRFRALRERFRGVLLVEVRPAGAQKWVPALIKQQSRDGDVTVRAQTRVVTVAPADVRRLGTSSTDNQIIGLLSDLVDDALVPATGCPACTCSLTPQHQPAPRASAPPRRR